MKAAMFVLIISTATKVSMIFYLHNKTMKKKSTNEDIVMKNEPLPISKKAEEKIEEKINRQKN